MVHAKNYETMSTIVKVMQKKLWPLFFRTRCICIGAVLLKGELAKILTYDFFVKKTRNQFIKTFHLGLDPSSGR